MFRSRRGFGYGRQRRRSKKSFSPLWFVVAVPLIVIAAEILAMLFVNIQGKKEEIKAYKGEPAFVTAYRLQLLNKSKKPIDGISNHGQLGVYNGSAAGYSLNHSQENDYWKINEQGWREDENIPMAKPKGEIRIFILGGSTAFGQGTIGNDATIASYLEGRLQQRVEQQKRSPGKYRPDTLPFYQPTRVKAMALPPKIKQGNYRVINVAVPGYTSGNEFAQFAVDILPYQPDLIVVLNGYEDLMLPSSEKQTTLPYVDDFLANSTAHFTQSVKNTVNSWISDSYAVKTARYFFLQPQPTVDQETMVFNWDGKRITSYLPDSPEELQLRLDRYKNNQKQLIKLGAANRVPVMLAIQPEITAKATQSSGPTAEILNGLGNDYQTKMKEYYPELIAVGEKLEKDLPNNVKFIDFYDFDKLPVDSFMDAIHLNDEGNKAIAEQLYYSIADLSKMQIQPENFNL